MNMKTPIAALAVLAMSAAVVSCNPSPNTNDGDDAEGAVVVNALEHSKEFPGATLEISSITTEKVGSDSAKVTVRYDVQNFQLTEQTDHDHHMANSHDGQHIHFILDNTPYAALYKPEHTVTLPVNSEHYLMSFLSRSFHESIKTDEASKLVKFRIDADGKIEQLPTPTEIGLFYSRPKGEYKGVDAEQLLLDFFVANGTLGADGYKVKADINGEEFVLDEWVPYEILSLPLGESTIRLTLLDRDGNPVAGDNVSVERKINLVEN